MRMPVDSLGRRILTASMISVALNGVLIVLSLLALGENRSVAGRIADAIAAPPGKVAEQIFAPAVQIFAPKDHSIGTFLLGAAASLLWSIVFYAMIAMLALEWRSSVDKRRADSRG
jgi:hypothetical protein